LREIFVTELVKEILGPRNGPYEEMKRISDSDERHSGPLFEYITGVLAPVKSAEKGGIESDAEIPFEESGAFEEETDDVQVYLPPYVSPVLDPKARPPSMGLAFTVRAKKGVPIINVCVTWARYFYDVEKKIWKRQPRFFIKKIAVNQDAQLFINGMGLECSSEEAEISLHILSKHLEGDRYHISIFLVNRIRSSSPGEHFPRTEHYIFQPQIRVVCEPDTEIIPTLSKPRRAERQEELLDFLYRDRAVKARGFLCSAMWKEIDPENTFENELDFAECKKEPPFYWVDGELLDEENRKKFTCPDVRSEFIPIYHIPAPKLDWDERYGPSPILEASKLSECWKPEDLHAALNPLITGYQRWISEMKNSLEKFNEYERSLAEELIENVEDCERRIREGLELLCRDDDARLAFCFANKALDLQFCWTKKKPLIWRPFQLAFFLMVIKSIVDPKSQERKICDLLWVPTGAGKTEAYLAIAVFTLAYRRRRAFKRNDGDKTGAGTSVITRYTLRLLTIQQFRRTLATILACEYLRVCKAGKSGKIGWRPQDCEIDDEFLWGSTPFYIGLWVGGKVAPNKLLDIKGRDWSLHGALSILKGRQGEGEPAQVLECPVCGAKLAIPEKGLPPGRYRFYLIVHITGDLLGDFQTAINDYFSRNEITLKLIRIVRMNIPDYLTLEFEISSNRNIKPSDIDELWKQVHRVYPQLTLVPVRASRPGYFIRYYIDSRGKRRDYDFDIFCPNPECQLRSCIWIGGAPSGLIYGRRPGIDLAVTFPDGNKPIEVPEPFRVNQDVNYIADRIPIPALTVDEQIYHRIPSLLISTVDKFARPPFEPRAAAIFGNVEYHHCIFGYYRRGKGMHYSQQDHKGHPSPIGRAVRYFVKVNSLDPPDLILQDELHLIEGPLGSLVGIYETAVEFLCLEGRDFGPKYIASTATVRRAEEQVRSLFVRELKIFPPPGLTIDNRFFIRDFEVHPLEDKIPGRLYLGICALGRGPHTPIVRIWSRLLQTAWRFRNHPEIDFYWTLTGYFNAIRELAGVVALYRQDIPQRLREIAGNDARPISDERAQELSSRINSTDLPAILDSLNRCYPNLGVQDSLFTTSMFGTGVDIPRIGLMVVHGQPKTTSTYIQSTGRVGRTRGALVVVFLRATRPRDLNHYEFFCGYHRQLHRYVEPPTVFPFAPYALKKALGPVIVFMLRNMKDVSIKWCENASAGVFPRFRYNASELDKIISFILKRVSQQPSTRSIPCDEMKEYIDNLLDIWYHVAMRNQNLLFEETLASNLWQNSVVLGDPFHQYGKVNYGVDIVYENAPQSLREVEETIGLRV